MPLIGITNCRKLEDYRQSVLHVGGEVRVLDPSPDVDDALEGPRRRAADRRRRRRPGAVRRSATRDILTGRTRPRSVRDRARQTFAREGSFRCSRSAAAFRSSTSRAAARWCRTSRRRCRARCRTVSRYRRIRRWSSRTKCGSTKTRSSRTSCGSGLGHRRVRRQQPPSSGRPRPRARLHRIRDRPRRGHRSHRGSQGPLLPGRPVAPGKLLPHRRIPPALRRLRRRRRPHLTLDERREQSGRQHKNDDRFDVRRVRK